jgi:hypothetical protein
MRRPVVDDVVRLTRDIPHLNLHAGRTGVVRSLWMGSQVAYEVEFIDVGLDERTRAVLLQEQLSLTDAEVVGTAEDDKGA